LIQNHFNLFIYSIQRKEKTKITELRLKSGSLSTSPTREVRARSAFKLTRHEKNQLIDDTADLLASMVKSRRATDQDASFSTQQVEFLLKSVFSLSKFKFQALPLYSSRHTDPSPRTLEYSFLFNRQSHLI